jgi:hypothetical protein
VILSKVPDILSGAGNPAANKKDGHLRVYTTSPENLQLIILDISQ